MDLEERRCEVWRCMELAQDHVSRMAFFVGDAEHSGSATTVFLT
jgi:hypothetical protein